MDDFLHVILKIWSSSIEKLFVQVHFIIIVAGHPLVIQLLFKIHLTYINNVIGIFFNSRICYQHKCHASQGIEPYLDYIQSEQRNRTLAGGKFTVESSNRTLPGVHSENQEI